MSDYIVFTVSDNFYALSVEMIQRIIQIPDLTPIPNAHKVVDGMMSYEAKVIKVLNFRKMTGIEVHEEDQKEDSLVKSQKLLICQSDDQVFGIKVDRIEDIVSLENDAMKQVERLSHCGDFIDVSGVVELEDRLVNVIKSVMIPTKECM